MTDHLDIGAPPAPIAGRAAILLRRLQSTGDVVRHYPDRGTLRFQGAAYDAACIAELNGHLVQVGSRRDPDGSAVLYRAATAGEVVTAVGPASVPSGSAEPSAPAELDGGAPCQAAARRTGTDPGPARLEDLSDLSDDEPAPEPMTVPETRPATAAPVLIATAGTGGDPQPDRGACTLTPMGTELLQRDLIDALGGGDARFGHVGRIVQAAPFRYRDPERPRSGKLYAVGPELVALVEAEGYAVEHREAEPEPPAAPSVAATIQPPAAVERTPEPSPPAAEAPAAEAPAVPIAPSVVAVVRDLIHDARALASLIPATAHQLAHAGSRPLEADGVAIAVELVDDLLAQAETALGPVHPD